MSRTHLRFAALVAAAGLASALAPAGEAPPKTDEKTGEKAGEKAKQAGKKAPPPGPKTHKVKRGPFRVKAKLAGVFEARATSEVVFRPEAWSALTVKKAVEHGTRVKAGEVILALEAEKIDEAIEDMEAGQELADLGLALAKEEGAALEQTTPLDLAAAERAKRHADEDLKQYEKTDRALWIKQTNQSLRNSERYLAYELEELRQLEKMYRADDLTEETEEIILERQRHTVERVRLSLEARKAATEKTLGIELPRRDVSVKDAARRKQIDHEKARETLPAALRKKRLEIEKMERALKKSGEKLEKLRRDRETMTVRASVDGVVYTGRSVRGQWTGLGQVLSEGTSVKPHAVVMTIVVPRPVFIRTSVPEKLLSLVRPGLAGKAVPAALPDVKLEARMESVSAVPTTAGKFDARVTVDLTADAAAVMPGMTCSLEFVPYENKDAISVPAGAVFSDELDEDAKHVFIKKKDGGHEKRAVTVGKTSGGKVEIVAGLAPGEVVLLQKPKDAK